MKIVLKLLGNNFGYIILAVFFYLYTVGRVFGFERAYYPVFIVAILFAVKEYLGDIKCLTKYKQWLKWQFSFILLLLVSVIWSPNPNAFSYWLSMLIILVKIITVAIICSKEDGFENLMYTLAITGLAVCFTLHMTGNLYSYRTTQISFMDNENSFGLIAAIFALGSFMSIQQSKKLICKLFFIGCILADLYMVIMTGGRKFLIFLFILVSGYYLLSNQNIKFSTLIFWGIFSVIGVYALYYAVMHVNVFYDAIGYRFDGAIEGEDDQKELMLLALDYFRKKPLFGLGVAGYQYLNPHHCYSHSNYTELLANFGIVGTMLYYSQFIHCIKILLHNRFMDKNNTTVFLSIIIAILALDVFSVNFNMTAFVPLLIMLVSGYCFELQNKTNYVTV